jgi:hypothetical protein
MAWSAGVKAGFPKLRGSQRQHVNQEDFKKETHMSRFPRLTAVLRSAAVALSLGGAVMVAAPAVAAPPPHIDFHFGFGGGGLHWGGGKWCFSDRQVRRFLQWHGYDHIRYTDRKGRIVTVRAERRHRDYRISVDSCRARIVSIKRIWHR